MNSPASQPTLIDTHVHVFERSMPLVDNPRHRPAYDFTPADLLAVMDRHGVERAVIAAASPWGDYNDYVIAALASEARLRGTVILDTAVERVTLDAMNAAGIVGVRLPFISMPVLPDLTSFAWRKLLRRFVDLDWHVHLHLDGPRLPLVLPLLEASGVKIVIDHIGRPDAHTGVEGEGFSATLRSVEKGRTWVKMSGAYRLAANATDCARELYRQLGADKLFWASDCPFVGGENDITYERTIAWLRDVVTNEADLRRIYRDNAAAFYFGDRT